MPNIDRPLTETGPIGRCRRRLRQLLFPWENEPLRATPRPAKHPVPRSLAQLPVLSPFALSAAPLFHSPARGWVGQPLGRCRPSVVSADFKLLAFLFPRSGPCRYRCRHRRILLFVLHLPAPLRKVERVGRFRSIVVCGTAAHKHERLGRTS